jgi:NADH-quinone oxidoreductase subunit G
MPKLIIDDRQIEVAPKTMVIEAAAQLGIVIPRFCYHPALGSVGACRVCAVKFSEGPLKGIQMSCMVEAQDGMVVSTTDKEAVDFRKSVIEWLMLHHPHDCPVCDEGGHCLLQDMTVSGGHGIRRYAGNKRTYADQYLGPLLQHEMNRCIHCYRCSRYYQEFTGYHDLGVMCIANRTYFGRFEDGILQNPFSGNLSDICPTGVYTDKPSRYFGRRWDYERHPSLCINCSLGCGTVVSVKYREVKRQEARFCSEVNGYFICDRGRYGFLYASSHERPRRARVDGQEVHIGRAVEALRQKIAEIERIEGSKAIAWAGSLRNSIETQAMLNQASQLNDWPNPSYLVDQAMTRKVKSAISRLEPELAVSLRQVEASDFILTIGADPINEAPMLALAMRQAQRNGAEITVIDPRPVSLPFAFTHLPSPPSELNFLASSLTKAAVGREAVKELGQNAVAFYDAIPDVAGASDTIKEKISSLSEKLQRCQRPIVVCGLDVVRESTPQLAADLGLCLKAAGKKAGLFYLMPGANAFGAGIFSGAEDSFEKTIHDIENGVVKALVLVENNPFWQFPNRQRLEQALDRLDLFVVCDYVNSAAAQRAHIFLPTTTLYETAGVYINQGGRAQAAPQAFAGGIPAARTGRGDHPPRIYGAGIPGSEPGAAWQILAELAGVESHSDPKKLRMTLWKWLTETIPGFTGLPPIDEFPDEGIRLNLSAQATSRFSIDWSAEGKDIGDNLELITVDWTFGTEELSGFSECLHELEPQPVIFLSTGEAQNLGFADGDRISIQSAGGSISAELKVVENLAPGVLMVPRHRKLPWQIFEPGSHSISREQIKKATV